MLRYAIRNILFALPVVLLISTISFFLIHMLPGDAAGVLAGSEATAEEIERTRQQLGLDQPLLLQLVEWVQRMLWGDFGRSLVQGESVLALVTERAPITISLAVTAMVIAVPTSIVLGTLSAYYSDTVIDRAISLFCLLSICLPSFWMGILAIGAFSVNLGWFPSSGYTPVLAGIGSWMRSLILPASVLALLQIGFLTRITRTELRSILQKDYVMAARARGAGELRVILAHVLRNGMLTIIAACGVIISMLISGAVVTETVFSLPGIGRLVVQGVFNRDYPLIQGALIIIAIALVAVNLVVDMIYRMVDPRVRF